MPKQLQIKIINMNMLLTLGRTYEYIMEEMTDASAF
jgi:hypothetical protein